MIDLISEYWVLLAIVAAIGVATAWWILASRRHVELPRIEIGSTATQTLSRSSASAGVGVPLSPPEAPLPFEVFTDHDIHPDDLLQIKGVGPRLARMLMDLGIVYFRQIAAWSPDDVAAVDARLGPFAGRAARDNWVEQARLLETGDTLAFQDKFGRLGQTLP